MKALMYHYVREGDADLPYFRYLHIQDFRDQLSYLQDNFTLISKDQFLESLETKIPVENGVILTFDDGLIDHYNVTQILAEQNLWGIFYIPTGCYETGKLINVHRVHMLLGRFGGPAILEVLQDILTEEMVIDKDVLRFHDITYHNVEENDVATAYVKKLMNFSIRDTVKDRVLDQLMVQFFDDEKSMMQSYYLSRAQIQSMHDAGMMIGAHSVSHPVFSKLGFDEQKREICDSFGYLEDIVGAFKTKTFCYPYGEDYTFDQNTLDILQQEHCAFSFGVEQKDIQAHDIIHRPQALPRYDCNQFPHGKASMGIQRPHEMTDNAA